MPWSARQPDAQSQLLPQRCLVNGRPQTAPHRTRQSAEQQHAADDEPQQQLGHAAAGHARMHPADVLHTSAGRQLKRPHSAAGALQQHSSGKHKSRPNTAASGHVNLPLHATNPALARLREQLIGLTKLTTVSLSCLDEIPAAGDALPGYATDRGADAAGAAELAAAAWKDVDDMTEQEVAYTYEEARQAAAKVARSAVLRHGGRSRKVLLQSSGDYADSGTSWERPTSLGARREREARASKHSPGSSASNSPRSCSDQDSSTNSSRSGSSKHGRQECRYLGEHSSTGAVVHSVFGSRPVYEEDGLTKAHKELVHMKEWLGDREAHIKQASIDAATSSCALSRDTAAAMGSIRAGTELLRTQRRLFEEALARMQSAPGFRHSTQTLELSEPGSGEVEDVDLEAALAGGKSFAKSTGTGNSLMGAKSCRSVWRAHANHDEGAGRTYDDDSDEDEEAAQQEQLPDLDAECPEEAAEGSSSFKARHKGSFRGSDPSKLQLPHSGLRPRHLGQALKEALQPWLASIDMGGNLLNDGSIGQLVQLLAASPAAASLRDLDLSGNTLLTWRCCQPLSHMLGPWLEAPAGASSGQGIAAAAGAAGAGAGAGSAAGGAPAGVFGAGGIASGAGVAAARVANPLKIRRLVLQDVQLGDKGALLLAAPLHGNASLQALMLRRCGISDVGGAAICAALSSNSALQELSIGWNALAHATAAALERALRSNKALRWLCLAHNGLNDIDGACVLASLCGHAGWRHVDLSSNCLEGGAALTACQVIKALRAAAQEAAALAVGAAPGGRIATAAAAALESREVVLDGNPLGFSGARCLMHALAGSPPIAPAMPHGPHGSIESPVTVSILGCSLIAMEKGFRPNLTRGQAAGALVPQTLQLSSAVAQPGASKARSGAAAAAPATTAVQLPPGARPLVVTEGVAGLDLVSPGGQYALNLTHPASTVIMEELLDLKSRLQDLTAMQPHHQNPEPPTAGPNRRASKADGGTGGPRPGSAASARPASPARPGSAASAGRPGSAAAARPASTAAGRPGSAASARPGSAVGKPQTGRPGSAAASGSGGAASTTKQGPRSSKVESITLTDIKLDGKAIKLEQLLRHQPWAAARQLPGDDGDDDEHQGSAAGKPAKVPQRLEFGVKAAAVLVAAEQRAVPERLMQWVLQVMQHSSSTELWKLHIAQALCTDWLLLPGQALAVLQCFDKELGREEQLQTAQLFYAQLVQPMEFWGEVLPALNPMQQQRFKESVGTLMSLDRANLCGSYTLNLGHPLDRVVALRLQRAALQEDAYEQSRYFAAWRNASFNARPLREDAILRLHQYAMPHSGTLQLDYVTYRVPKPSSGSASEEQLQALLQELRTICSAYQHRTLAMRREYLPQGKRASEEEEARLATKLRAKGKLKGALMAAGLAGGKAVPSGSSSAAIFAGTRAGSASSTPAEAAAAAPAAAAAVDTASEGPWWGGCGFDGLSLLLKLHLSRAGSRKPTRSASQVAAAAAAAADEEEAAEPLPAAGGDAAAAVAATGEGAPGAAKSGSRPVSAQPAAASRPTSAAVAAKAVRPKSGRSTASEPQDAEAAAAQARVDTLVGRMLHASSPAEVAAKFACLSDRAAQSVFIRLCELPNGVPVAAKLLGCLSPAVAARFVIPDLPDASSASLLPYALRQRIEPHLAAAVKLALADVGAELAESQRKRSTALALCVRRFVAKETLSVEQLVRVLGSMAGHVADRCSAVVCAWARVVDRQRLVEVFESLTGAEQLDIMRRLGFYYVWSTLTRPEGLHFRLDLRQPEQREVAKEVVKTAIRKSLAERARTGQRVRQLENLVGSGNKHINDPEDEKLWLSIESKHTLVEFDYARTWEQELHHMAAMVRRIQRHWRETLATRAAAAAAAAAEAEAAQRQAQLLAEQAEAEAAERALMGGFEESEGNLGSSRGASYSDGSSSSGAGVGSVLEQQPAAAGDVLAKSSALQEGFMALAARLANSGYHELAAKLTPRRQRLAGDPSIAAAAAPAAGSGAMSSDAGAVFDTHTTGAAVGTTKPLVGHALDSAKQKQIKSGGSGVDNVQSASWQSDDNDDDDEPSLA